MKIETKILGPALAGVLVTPEIVSIDNLGRQVTHKF